MSVIKYTAISLSLLLLAGCSDDQAAKTVVPPVIKDAERLAPVSLQIPGVGGGPTTTQVMATDNSTANNVETIERAIPAEDAGLGSVVPTVDAPLPLLLSDVVQRRFSNPQSGSNVIPMLEAIFYPLGWSADGKFAYAVEPPDEAAGIYMLNIYIQDLVTDKVLWKQEYKSNPGSTTDAKSFAAYWGAGGKLVQNQFKKYGIVESKQTDLMGGPIGVGNDRLTYQVQKTVKAQPEYGNTEMVTAYQVMVKSDTHGSKVVHKETYKKPISVTDVDVIGYLQGSDSERVALLVSGVRLGWEGPPHVTWFKVIGTNLRRGFK